MKTFEIVAPIAGEVTAQIKAESAEEARDLFHENWSKAVKTEEVDVGEMHFEVNSLESYDEICSGNVCHVDCYIEGVWKLEIEEVKEEE